MLKILGIGAVVLGAIGILFCVFAIGLGWRMTRTASLIDRAAVRLDSGLSETDARLARVESRVSTLRAEIKQIRGGAEALIAENPELPRVQAEIERLLDRLVPAFDRVETMADLLSSVGSGLRAAADIVVQFTDHSEATARIRNAADAIDHAAETLSTPGAKVDELKSNKAIRTIQKLVALSREALAGSDLLAEGLAAARLEIVVARKWAAEKRDAIIFWIYAAAVANTVFWLWCGLGQLCLINWGRRRIVERDPTPA
jgi:hypothetical protein